MAVTLTLGASAATPPVGELAVLVSQARAGSRDAERELCQRLAPAVRSFARRRLRTSAAVEDFAHDVLLTFVEALRAGRIRDPEQAAPFALGICRNLARDRARTRDRREALDQCALLYDEARVPWEPVLLDRARLEDCLSLLTSRARSILRRTFHDERADEEIASELEISAGNVRVIRHRCLTALRECLEKPLSWEGR